MAGTKKFQKTVDFILYGFYSMNFVSDALLQHWTLDTLIPCCSWRCHHKWTHIKESLVGGFNLKEIQYAHQNRWVYLPQKLFKANNLTLFMKPTVVPTAMFFFRNLLLQATSIICSWLGICDDISMFEDQMSTKYVGCYHQNETICLTCLSS